MSSEIIFSHLQASLRGIPGEGLEAEGSPAGGDLTDIL